MDSMVWPDLGRGFFVPERGWSGDEAQRGRCSQTPCLTHPVPAGGLAHVGHTQHFGSVPGPIRAWGQQPIPLLASAVRRYKHSASPPLSERT